MQASMNGRVAVMKTLLNNGADLNDEDKVLSER
jgi:hypothetical protein